MSFEFSNPTVKKSGRAALLATALVVLFHLAALAHPLGNFTVNHYSRLQIKRDTLLLRLVVDMAEIPAFQTLQSIDRDADGKASDGELHAYAEQTAAQYAQGLRLSVDGEPTRLKTVATEASTPTGNGGLPTLRLVCEYVAEVRAGVMAKQIKYEDTNNQGRAGWREIVITPDASLAVFDSTAYGNAVTDELKAYPDDLLSAPLDERRAEFSVTAGMMPEKAVPLKTREGRAISQSRDRFAELIAVEELTLPVALLGLLIAAGLGAVHALSPGHGKTVVGAYLVGSRGTAKHAAFLGLTVTITHTLGVFALGLITLFASEFILPEKLFPVINLISGVIVLFLGLSLFFKRLSVAMGAAQTHHHHGHAHSHDHPHHHDHDHDRLSHDHRQPHAVVAPAPAVAHSHHPHPHQYLTPDRVDLTPLDSHEVGDSDFTHTHDGHTHTHMPPGTDGSAITWKSLLALGISGGLLPCPSALVVLLAAIAFNRVGFGLLLVVAFSLGLAATLTAVGLLFLYAGRLLKRPMRESKWLHLLPVVSALVIACLGAVLCYQALSI